MPDYLNDYLKNRLRKKLSVSTERRKVLSAPYERIILGIFLLLASLPMLQFVFVSEYDFVSWASFPFAFFLGKVLGAISFAAGIFFLWTGIGAGCTPGSRMYRIAHLQLRARR